MKILSRILLLLSAALLAGEARGQTAISVELPFPSFVRFETIRATIKVRNDTDAPLVVGGVGGSVTLDLDVRARDEHKRQQRKTRGPLVSNVIVSPGETKDIAINISDHFDLQNTGQYSLKAEITTPAGVFQSAAQVIDVVPGIELQTVERAVPSQPSVMRVYKLLYLARDSTEHLFLSVTAKDGRTTFGVFDLGPVMRFVPPDLSVDVSGKIIVRHQPDYEVTVLTLLQSSPREVTLVSQERKIESGSSE